MVIEEKENVKYIKKNIYKINYISIINEAKIEHFLTFILIILIIFVANK